MLGLLKFVPFLRTHHPHLIFLLSSVNISERLGEDNNKILNMLNEFLSTSDEVSLSLERT